MTHHTTEEYVERVLACVESVPPGWVTTYGAIAAVAGGGPRQVGSVLARHGGPVPWWRVVRADGSPPLGHESAAHQHYVDEQTPRRSGGAVDLGAAFVEPSLPQPLDGGLGAGLDEVM